LSVTTKTWVCPSTSQTAFRFGMVVAVRRFVVVEIGDGEVEGNVIRLSRQLVII